MRKQQLIDAKRGTNLLLGHLKGAGERLDTAMENEDKQALIDSADALVTVAVILIRMLRDASGGTIDSTLSALRSYSDPELVPLEFLEQFEKLAADIISEGFSPPNPIGGALAAIVAHDAAIGAATEISKLDGRHVNKVIADLHIKLKEQGGDVQITDPDGASAASDKYAADPEMVEARELAARALIDYWERAAIFLHNRGSQDQIIDVCKDSLEALALISITITALVAGVWQLSRHKNIYPAWTLLRQLVETEFILWRFAKEPTQMPAWVNSTAEERRLNWKPTKIYRDSDNDYRQKDYSVHCELGGHPTPNGGRLIGATPNIKGSFASAFTECINHAWEAWRHLLAACRSLNDPCTVGVLDELEEINQEFVSTIKAWTSVDMYRRTTAFFSDPID